METLSIPRTPAQVWRITAAAGSLELRRHCPGCRSARSFRSSGKFRVNAQRKRIDAWLIYRCGSCDTTWNRPVLERVAVQSVDPVLLRRLQANDADLARSVARGAASSSSVIPRGSAEPEIRVERSALPETGGSPEERTIILEPEASVPIRLDRLLARELGIPRSRIGRWAREGRIRISPGGPKALRRSLRQRMEIRLQVGENGPSEGP